MSWFVELAHRLGRPAPRVWVETGTFRGDTTAEQVAWFSTIITIDLDPALAAAARERFKDEPSIAVLQGDSAEVLATLCDTSPKLREPVLFYLDGHWSGGITARGRPEENGCPLLRELEVLGKRPYDDIIVIDDARLFGKIAMSGSGGDWPPTQFDWRHITEDSIRGAYGRRAALLPSEGIDRLILLPIPVVTPEQVADRKRRIAELSKAFPYTRQTNISLIVLSFNHRSRIPSLLDRMRRTSAQEVIVCEDGSWDGSLDEWDRLLVRRNDFLLRSNDLHEIRAYDRAIHLASAPIVCLLQDDDLLPENGAWVHEALALFDAIPTLAIVSGYCGFMGEVYGKIESEGACVIPYLSPVTGRPFMYIAEAYVGPFFVRKSFYEAAGGFDHAYSEPGECGMLFEADLCYRAWVAGWRVGLVDCFVKGDAGAGVTPGTWWSGGTRTEAFARNGARLDASFRRTVGDEVSARARTLNDATLIPAPMTGPGVTLPAGAVLHRGRVILLLGESRRQTVDLVEALVRHGATLISTDMVRLEPQGRIRIPSSATGPTPGVPTDLAISLIATMHDGATARSEPTALAGARAALLILSRIASPGRRARRLMDLAAKLASGATTLSGLPRDADASAPLILGYLDRFIEDGARGLPAE